MSYITKDQLNLYLQNVHTQAPKPGLNNGTTKSRSTLTGPRPPTFGTKANSRKIFQDGPPSTTLPSPATPTTPSTTHLDHAVKSLSLSSAPIAPNPRSASPILESMGETGPLANEHIMESMGSDGYGLEDAMYHQHLAQSQHFGWTGSGYGMGPHPHQHPGGYGNQAPPHQYYNTFHGNHQQQHPMHMSQEQYFTLQQRQYQQPHQDYIRHQHLSQAAAHGYHPSPTPSASMQSPAGSHIQQPGSTSTPSKTITPRIVPIVDIPKYTVVNPPKAEVEVEAEAEYDEHESDQEDEQEDEQDDDWAPEPPPRDIPRKNEIKPVEKSPALPPTPIEAVQPPSPPMPKVEVPTKPRVTESLSHSLSKPITHPTTGVTGENSMPTEEDRVPLPPPREFRRKSPASPTLTTATTKTTLAQNVSDGVFRLGSPSRPTSSPTNSSSSVQTSRTNSPKRANALLPGTVRANSAMFNAMAASNKENTVSRPNSVSPKSSTSTISRIDTSTPAGTNPWSARKAGINGTEPRSSTPKSAKSMDMFSDTSSSKSLPLSNVSEADVNKELPPIRPETPKSRSGTPEVLVNHQMDGQLDIEHDSKCILTEEDKLAGIPLANDTSKEILVEQEKPATPVADKPASTPTKPPRRNSSAAGSRFICASCDEPITGVMITAMGKSWHSDHFVCCVCDVNLEHIQFFQRDGQAYCHLDYHDKFSPKCGHCNTAIENECLTALGKNWHPGHFFCRECGDPFDEDGYMVHDDFPYCEKDYLRLFAPKCTGCQGPIQGDFINALKGKWHRDCFGCAVCHIGFDSASYFVAKGKPYCQAHYKSAIQSVEA